MGKHDKKTGKGRLDKFYKLAKEQGYRARSAFKLIHLNRKYDLLSRSRCVIDLCAAPGGWLQVAEKYMPKGSLIVGVDLNPIKPLPHVITFVSDITSPQCRTQLRGHLHDWQADLVLHDGAPNVGSAWVQDAFTQNELVLQSLKLATDFLAKGGNFVTKVFRSQDYNSLMWVFGQLFKTVEATKPPSSRNVSAEIFVVCRDFVAPKHIDPKFLDPKHVFKDIAPLPASITLPPIDPSSSTSAATQASTSASAAAAARLASNSHAHANVFMPEKKRRNREGYAEGDNLLFHTALAEDFVRGTDPVALLGSMNKIVIVSEQEQTWLKSRHTTPDVIANFEDLKVLGKGDFKSLMKWRLAIRLETGLDVKPVVTADVTEEVTVEPMDEDEQMSEELKKLHQERQSRQRKERRRKNEKKARELLKMQLNMAVPADLDNEDRALGGEEEMFDLGEGEKEASRGGIRKGLRDVVQDEDGLSGDDDEASAATEEEDEEILDSEEEREAKLHGLEGELDELYNQYRERMSERDAKWKVKHARNKDRNQDAWYGFEGGSDGEDGVDKGYRERMVRVPRQDGDDGGGGEESEEGGWDVVAAGKAKLGEEIDSSDEESEEEEEDDNNVAGKASRKTVRFPQSTAAKPVGAARNLVTSLQDGEKLPQMSRQAQLWFAQPVFKDLDDLLALDGDDEDDGENVEASEEVPSEEESLDEPKEDGDVEMEEASVTSSTLEDDNDDDDFGIVPQQPIEDGPGWDVDDEDQDEMKRKTIQDKGLLTAEAVTLATALVNRQTTASKLIDDGFNRLSTFHKDGLPTWFLDDESKYYKPNIPLTKEAIDALREKQRALDARPIKKIAEAKARKKFKAVQRVEKAKKKADGVMEADDLNMNEKARAIGKVMGRAHGREKKVDKKIVVAKGANRGVKGRPKGVKGKYKIVDARMRKEVRAQKRIKKANKKR